MLLKESNSTQEAISSQLSESQTALNLTQNIGKSIIEKELKLEIFCTEIQNAIEQSKTVMLETQSLSEKISNTQRTLNNFQQKH